MLELKNLYFTVQESDGISGARRNIIDGIDFTFEKGKFYVITGPNGSGKTTLAKLIMGINPISQRFHLFRGQGYFQPLDYGARQSRYRLQFSATRSF